MPTPQFSYDPKLIETLTTPELIHELKRRSLSLLVAHTPLIDPDQSVHTFHHGDPICCEENAKILLLEANTQTDPYNPFT